jgi:hypothetical protein
VPGIEVARAKVDVVEKPPSKVSDGGHGSMGAMGIRLPPHMRLAASEEGSGKGNL